MKLSKLTTAVLTASLMIINSGYVYAKTDSYPNKPIKVIVPFTAGGVVDSITRIIAEPLAKKIGQPIVVENKTGAGGSIGTEYVARSKPDGYTLLSVSPSHAVSPSLIKKLNYSVGDFDAIQGFGNVPNVFVVHPDSNIKTMQEFIDKAKNSESVMTYATAGLGTSNHLSGALLSQQAGIELEQISYRGQTDAIADLLAGRVDSMPLTSALAVQYIKDKKLQPLAVTTEERASALPDVPTVKESTDLSDYAVGTWFGWVAPKGVDKERLEKIYTELDSVLDTDEVKDKLQAIGVEINTRNPKEFDQFIVDEYEKWADVLKKAGVEAQ